MKISSDINGNRVVKIESSDLAGGRGFSIQTLGNLPQTHRNGIGPYTDDEIRKYLEMFGSARQKELFGV